ncbi:hypothetical protein NIES4075_53370 [Tolypothrix sp. NIES-4075]|nr:hypothetical protein NIES4075_53370 [Tolypothrix sp. NIES-4075]
MHQNIPFVAPSVQLNDDISFDTKQNNTLAGILVQKF